MQKYLIAFFLFLAGSGSLVSQTFLSAEPIGSYTAFQLSLLAGFPVDNGVEQFKVLYEMPGIDGNPDTVSGAIVIPTVFDQENLPLIVYQHPTSTNGPFDVPSSGGFSIGSLESIAYGAFGYVVFATDYLGLGESRGFHPYLHAETEALAGLNMIHAGLEYLEAEDGISWDSTNLFIAGYSQGGHASMALHRMIQESSDVPYNVTAAAHMSGPYSISDVMLETFLNIESTGSVAYMPYTILGYQSSYQTLFDSVSQVFKDPYADTIQNFYAAPYALSVLDGQLQLLLLDSTGSTDARELLQPGFLSQIEDPGSEISTLFRENDTYDWAPEAPTRLLYCPMDETVPAENALLADSVMRANGAPDVGAVNVNGFVNHVDCTLFAILESIDFFEESALTVSLENSLRKKPQVSIFPNPASEFIQVEGVERNVSYTIMNATGSPVLKGTTGDNQKVNLTFLPEGMYFLRIHSEDELQTLSFLVIRS